MKKDLYIWQHPEWPGFKWDSDIILEHTNRVNRQLGLLTGRMSMLGFGDKNLTRLDALTEELIGSSQIEGITLNADSIRSSIARRLGINIDGTTIEDHYVEGLVEVMLDALSGSAIPLSEERLFGWHTALFPYGRSGMHKIMTGAWRIGDEPMQVVSGAFGKEKVHYEAPPSHAVPTEMASFISWCNTSKTSPLLKAAIAHLWFISIHPFDDGNGRISRTISDMFLSQIDISGIRYYSMSAEINRQKKSYYDILEATQKGGLDITQWLIWFFQCLGQAIDNALVTTSRVIMKGVFWDKFRDINVNERQRKIINRLWDGFDGKLSSSKWAKICHCSQDTAIRDINDLIAKGILKDSGEGGRNTNYILTTFES